MIRPLENQERFHSKEYVNRIRQTEPGHSPNSRDFGYEIHEIEHDRGKKHSPEKEFGEDTYEATDEQPESNEPEKREPKNPAPKRPDDETNLDITV
jgi:hypothetical protein